MDKTSDSDSDAAGSIPARCSKKMPEYGIFFCALKQILRIGKVCHSLTTKGDNAKIELVENEPFRAVYKITNTITVPEAGDEAFEDEKRHMVFFKERKGGRSKNTVELTIETYVSLDKHGKGVKIKT